MGGAPYGRPMAMTGDDRDGLALDQLRVVLGPFLVGLPNGMRIHAVLQGGVVQEVHVEVLDLGNGPAIPGAEGAGAVTRQDLRWLSEALRLAGLGSLASRAARLARAGPPDPAACRAFARSVRRSGLPAAWSGVGPLDGADARDRLERRLAFEADGDAAPVSADRLAGALVGQDWADALVTIWSVVSSTDRSPAPTGHHG